jgi:hypothetical protein
MPEYDNYYAKGWCCEKQCNRDQCDAESCNTNYVDICLKVRKYVTKAVSDDTLASDVISQFFSYDIVIENNTEWKVNNLSVFDTQINLLNKYNEIGSFIVFVTCSYDTLNVNPNILGANGELLAATSYIEPCSTCIISVVIGQSTQTNSIATQLQNILVINGNVEVSSCCGKFIKSVAIKSITVNVTNQVKIDLNEVNAPH